LDFVAKLLRLGPRFDKPPSLVFTRAHDFFTEVNETNFSYRDEKKFLPSRDQGTILSPSITRSGESSMRTAASSYQLIAKTVAGTRLVWAFKSPSAAHWHFANSVLTRRSPRTNAPLVHVQLWRNGELLRSKVVG
jgi:hypothetical protein